MKKRVVGIDVTSRTIRAVQVLHKTGQRPVVEKFIEFPLDTFDADLTKSRASNLAKHFRDLWTEAGFKTKLVAVGIGGADVFVKTFVAPDLPKHKLKKALPELVKAELPMAVEEVVLDFYANGRFESEGESKLNGLLVAANRETVGDFMEATRAAKLKIVSIDLIPFALTRHLAKRRVQTGVKAFVRASNSYINIVVTEGNTIAFVRLVPWERPGTSQSQLADTFDADSKGLFVDSANPITSDITVIQAQEQQQTALQRQAVRELEETVAFFHQNYPDKHIEEILVSGYRLDNKAFIDALSKGKNVWVTGVTRSGLGHKRSTVSTVEDPDLPDHLAVALALADGVEL